MNLSEIEKKIDEKIAKCIIAIIKAAKKVKLSGIITFCIIVAVIIVSVLYNSLSSVSERALKAGISGDCVEFSKYLTQGTGEQLAHNIASFYSNEEKYKEVSEELLSEFFGDGIKIKTNVISKEKLEGEELESVKNKYISLYNEKINKAYRITAEYSITGNKNQSSDSKEFIIIKYDGDWCVEDYSILSDREQYLKQ